MLRALIRLHIVGIKVAAVLSGLVISVNLIEAAAIAAGRGGALSFDLLNSRWPLSQEWRDIFVDTAGVVGLVLASLLAAWVCYKLIAMTRGARGAVRTRR